METIILLAGLIAVAILFFFIGRGRVRVIKPSSEEIVKYSIENVEFVNKLNPLVKQIYLQFVQDEKFEYFQQLYCTLLISNLGVEFWYENDVYNRRFTVVPDSILKELDMTLSELNKTLSMADKKILDTIAKRVVKNNKEFIERIFI